MERLQIALWHKAVLSFSSHLMHLLWWRGRCIFWGGSMPPRLGRGCINRLPVKFSSNSSSTNFHFFSRSCTKVRWNKPATLRRHTGQAHSFSTTGWGTIWGLLGGNKKLRSWRLNHKILLLVLETFSNSAVEQAANASSRLQWIGDENLFYIFIVEIISTDTEESFHNFKYPDKMVCYGGLNGKKNYR